MRDRRDRRRDVPERPTPHHDQDHDPGRDLDDAPADLAATATLEPAPLSEPASSRIRRGDATGLPDDLRGGLEALSGFDLGGVRVHRDSARPAAMGAAAYTAGTDIHLGPGQEEHLPHEAWHVVQQAQGRVAPTARIGDDGLNDSADLEHEADAMGARALGTPAPETEPRRRPGGRGGAVQLKWGQYDGKDRDAVRGILVNVGKIEPFPYELAGVLEDLLHQGEVSKADLETAARELPDQLTTTARAESLVKALKGGLDPAFARRAAEAEADDQALAPLLGLMIELAMATPAPPSVEVCRVASQLLALGRPVLDIADSVMSVPDLLTTADRAGAVVDHRLAGGTAADARLAAEAVSDDATALAAALTAVRTLAGIPGFGILDPVARKALVAERDHLTTDVLRTNAVALAGQGAPEDAAGALNRLRGFGYREDFSAHATKQGTEHEKDVVAQEKSRSTMQANADRGAAKTAQLTEAEKSLTRRQKDDLTAGEFTDRRKNAVKLRAEKAATLAQPEIDRINAREQDEHTAATTVLGPAARDQRAQEYGQWFATVHHHPRALDALKASGEDRDLAARLLTAVTTDQRAQAVLIDGKLSPFVLGNLLTVPAAVIGRLAAAGVTPATFGAYGVGAAQATLLAELGRALVPADRVTALVERFSTFQSHFSDPGEAARLADLLALTTVPEAYALRNACPTKVVNRMALLATLRPKALNAADLVKVLTFCQECDWDLTLLNNALGPLGNGLDLAALQAPVFRAELARFDKLTHFNSWLECVDRLIGAQHLTIRARGGWTRLNGEPLTDEQWYDVVPVAGGAAAVRVADFVVHYHPNASGPTISRPNDSKSHLKPRPGGDIRCKSPDLLKKLRPLIKMQP